MLMIETTGSWFEMGRQMGAKFPDELRRCIDRFVGIIVNRGADIEPAAAVVRSAAEQHCPNLVVEVAGMAEGSGIPESDLFKLRFYGDISMTAGCSAFFALDDIGGAWLGRTCDIEVEDHWHSTCHIRRLDNGCATLTTSYLGMVGGVGINEHGFALGGVSASTLHTYGDTGIFGSMLAHRILHRCQDVDQATAIVTAEPVIGKGAVWLAGDASGASVLYPIATGQHVEPIPRRDGATWQACTNFQPSASIPSKGPTVAVYNAYSRYGFLSHQIGDEAAPRTAEGLQEVIKGVAQPGPNIPDGSIPLQTAYGTLFELTGRLAYVAGGNPNTTPFQKMPFP